MPSILLPPVTDNYVQSTIDPCKILKSFFTDRGYKTGAIEIPELGVLVELKKNQFYRKEDNVQDIYQRINEIRSQFGLQGPHLDDSNGNGWCGVLSANCSEQIAYAYIVLVKKDLNDASGIYTTAHENGHFLWYTNTQELIYEKSTNPEFVKSCVQTNGDFAVLCGWIALKMEDYSLEECIIINSKDKEQEKKVEQIKNLVIKYFPGNN
ncbi:MAG: hypothetical protein PVH84_07505 [Candidatus Aminicenantes bacterium]